MIPPTTLVEPAELLNDQLGEGATVVFGIVPKEYQPALSPDL
jgi:hypothetical protein